MDRIEPAAIHLHARLDVILQSVRVRKRSGFLHALSVRQASLHVSLSSLPGSRQGKGKQFVYQLGAFSVSTAPIGGRRAPLCSRRR
jgi:hypothetical protein